MGSESGRLFIASSPPMNPAGGFDDMMRRTCSTSWGRFCQRLRRQQAAEEGLHQGVGALPPDLVLLVGAALEDLGRVLAGPGVGQHQARQQVEVAGDEGEGHVAAHRQPAQDDALEVAGPSARATTWRT